MSGGSGVRVSFDVAAPMRDGTNLRADIYRPDGDGPWPIILVRTPYSKASRETLMMVDPVQAARDGFLVVLQDVRGRFASDGDWRPFKSEPQDGYDSVEWAAKLPGSNGRVGMMGESYSAWTQWSAAFEGPAALKAMVPSLSFADAEDGLYSRGNAPETGLRSLWTLFVGLDNIPRLGLSEEEEFEAIMSIIEEFDGLRSSGLWRVPDPEGQILQRHPIPGMPGNAPATRMTAELSGSPPATLNISGWYDVFLQGAIDNYTGMEARGVKTRLLVGPWTHEVWADPIGEVSFGLMSFRHDVPHTERGNSEQFARDFLREYLDPGAATPLESPPVRYFTMGVNEWRDAETWPPPGSTTVRYYLRSDGGLSIEAGDGEGQVVEFDYDPADPVPTKGGPLLLVGGIPPGPVDQTSIEARDDVVVFTSDPLQDPLEVTGHVLATIWAQSSAPSTDWVVRLCDVHPDGRSLNIIDGIRRVSSDAKDLAPQEVDLWSTSHVFLPGHRIRVVVTSSSFPRWERNLNTGNQQAAEMEVAHQAVHVDAAHPSYVELPVMAVNQSG